MPVTQDQIQAAIRRIQPYVHHTPVLTSEWINRYTGATLFFKCENFQKAGAFKSRGAVNAVFSLDEADKKAGVCTHSSGNHAQALARAASLRGIPSYIVMPDNSPKAKVAAVQGYGGQITFCPPTLADRERTLAQVKAMTDATEIHPYNDYRTITGQATAAWEFHHQIVDLDIIMTPVGGGGLLSGTALSTAILRPSCLIYGAEPAGADDACRSLKAGHIIPSEQPKTIADGLLTSLGTLTFPIIHQHVKAIHTVSEENIILAMRTIWERMKIIVEPSAAVGLGVVLQYPELFKGRRTGVVLSGGNLDLDHLPWQ